MFDRQHPSRYLTTRRRIVMEYAIVIVVTLLTLSDQLTLLHLKHTNEVLVSQLQTNVNAISETGP